MPTFPTLSSGSCVKYPLTRRRKFRTQVLVFGDFTEQRFSKGSPLAEFDLAFTKIKTADKELVREFWNGRRGAFDQNWDLTIEDPPGSTTTYSHLQFSPGQQFEAVEDATGLWSFTLRVRQTKTAD